MASFFRRVTGHFKKLGVGVLAGCLALSTICLIENTVLLLFPVVIRGYRPLPALYVQSFLWYAIIGAALGLLIAILKKAADTIPAKQIRQISTASFSFSLAFGSAVFLWWVAFTRRADPLTLLKGIFVGVIAVAACAAIGAFVSTRVRRVLLGAGAVWFLSGLVLSGIVGEDPTRLERPPARSQSPAPADLPHIVLIALDALRADHLSCYGYARETSPYIDQLANEGLLFEWSFSQAPNTHPSTAALLSGLYPSTFGGLAGPGSRLSEEIMLLPEILEEFGYQTAAFSANPWVSPRFGFDQGFQFFYLSLDSITRYRLVYLMRTLGRKLFLWSGPKQMRSERLNEEIMHWVRGKEESRPLFVYIHYMDTHSAYEPPPPYDRKFDPDYRGRRVTMHPRTRADDLFPFVRGKEIDERERQNMIAQYDGEIAYNDAQIARLLEDLNNMLQSRGLWVIITADHGDEFYDHQNWGHNLSLFDELIHVPLIMYWPDRFSPIRVKNNVRSIDVYATIVDAIGGQVPDEAAGQSLRDLALGGDEEDRTVFSEMPGSLRAIIEGGFKLIEVRRGGEKASMLFDRKEDPSEEHNLAGRGLPAEEELERKLAEWQEHLRAHRIDTQQDELDPATREMLEALQYF